MPRTKCAASIASVALCTGLLTAANGLAPSWWTESGIIDSQAPDDDYQVANAGQLKNIATAAYDEMETALAQFGGAGPDVAAMVQGFTQDDNYAAINQGQLKNVAEPFYERLIEIGYCADVPWATGTPDNYSVINVGQLKNIFSFDLRVDSDADGLPDWWEIAHGLDPLDDGSVDPNQGAEGDLDLDGLNNTYEQQLGTDPNAANPIVQVSPSQAAIEYKSMHAERSKFMDMPAYVPQSPPVYYLDFHCDVEFLRDNVLGEYGAYFSNHFLADLSIDARSMKPTGSYDIDVVETAWCLVGWPPFIVDYYYEWHGATDDYSLTITD